MFAVSIWCLNHSNSHHDMRRQVAYTPHLDAVGEPHTILVAGQLG